MGIPSKQLLLDTNIFLHYRSIDEWDWIRVSGSPSVTLLIAPIVIRELNKHKDSPRNKKLRDRADAALKKLRIWSKNGPDRKLRENVYIEFLQSDPSLDFGEFGLVRDVADDWLVAHAIQLAASPTAKERALVTADLGLEMKAARHITCTEPPAEYKLPEEPTAEEKKLQELERTLREFQNAAPAIHLAFEQDSTSTTVLCYEHLVPPDLDIDPVVRKQIAKYPKRHVSPSNPNATGLASLLAGLSTTSADYDSELDTYFQEYRQHLNEMKKVSQWYSRATPFRVYAFNTGGAPAEDVDIKIHFPDGFLVLKEKQLPKFPEEPEPPETPEERMNSRFNLPTLYSPALDHYRMPDISPKNVNLLTVKKTNSHDATFHIVRLKHQGAEALPTVYLKFDSEPFSFSVDYRMVAGNIPNPVTGSLHVRPAPSRQELPSDLFRGD
jgi:hypothetical protein